ncbi:MAG: hypothetical protein GF344_17630, partial [Chitinivibrionales bacterium]|nr:hypothetical protein [Chitinivibrionales bacterium]MBD3358489.1 hypothetical protein [Chitinivibrionales bacterium]
MRYFFPHAENTICDTYNLNSETFTTMYPNSARLTSLACIVVFFVFIEANAVIAVTEILKDPVGGESTCPGGECLEFVEVTNSGPDTLVGENLFLTDGVTVDSIMAWPTALSDDLAGIVSRASLPPGRVAVIVDPQYTDAPEQDRFALAERTILWTVNKTSLVGKLSRDKGLLLYRGTRFRIDDSIAAVLDHGQKAALGQRLTHTSPPSAREGFGLVPSHLLFAENNWFPNPSKVNAGRYSALENGWLLEYRLGFVTSHEATIPCTVAVHHQSGHAPEGARWELKRTDSFLPIREGVFAQDKTPHRFIVPVPTDTVPYQIVLTDGGRTQSVDLDLSAAWLPSSPIKITEIFPRAPDNLPEWIEITNTSSMPINLCRWRLGTPEGNDTISTAPLIIAPAEYMVLTR